MKVIVSRSSRVRVHTMSGGYRPAPGRGTMTP